MSCGTCNSARADCDVLRDDRVAASLLDHDKGRRSSSRPTGMPSAGSDKMAGDTRADHVTMEMIGHKAIKRIFKFIFRGLFIMLGMYLFASMKRYAVDYIGGDTWFSTFAVITVAVPVAEVLCILGQILNELMPEKPHPESPKTIHSKRGLPRYVTIPSHETS